MDGRSEVPVMKLKFVTPRHALANTIDKWLTPAFPSWYKDLKISNYEAIKQDLKVARYCPAFVHLFKNSLLLRAPQDISSWIHDGGVSFEVPSHPPSLNFGAFDFGKSMGKEWAKYNSVKIDVDGSFIPEEGTTCLFFDPMYHLDDRVPLTAMTGVWPMYPDLYTPLSINMMGNRDCYDENGFLLIPRGTPLAYLYFPQGKPTIETETVSFEEYEQKHMYVRTDFVGDFLKKEMEILKE